MTSTLSSNHEEQPDLSYLLGCADFFRLTSMFLLNPSKELAQGVLGGSVFEDMRSIFEDAGIDPLPAMFEHEDQIRRRNPTAKEMQAELRRDYTELFTHPKRSLIAITEMRFRDERDHADIPSTPFLNEAALHAESCYRAAGLSLARDRSREPGDHLAIESAFMAYLHTRLIEALDQDNLDEYRQWEKALQEFEPHVTCWASDFFSACAESGCGAVYPWLGKVGVAFMERYLSDCAQ